MRPKGYQSVAAPRFLVSGQWAVGNGQWEDSS